MLGDTFNKKHHHTFEWLKRALYSQHPSESEIKPVPPFYEFTAISNEPPTAEIQDIL